LHYKQAEVLPHGPIASGGFGRLNPNET